MNLISMCILKSALNLHKTFDIIAFSNIRLGVACDFMEKEIVYLDSLR